MSFKAIKTTVELFAGIGGFRLAYNQYALYGNAIPPVFAGWVLDKILESRVTSLENVNGQQLHLFQEPMPYADKGGMSFALQWRYNFARVFKNNQDLRKAQ